MIAKRYHVSVDAVAGANGMRRSDPIHPGDELVIPARDDEDGSRALAQRDRLLGDDAGAAEVTKSRGSTGKPRVHMAGKGHTRGKIAHRYRVSVAALCFANEITKSTPLRIKQELVVPAPDDEDGSRARQWRQSETRAHRRGDTGGQSWRSYTKQAWKRGYITLESPNGDKRWSGYVIGPGNKLLPLARQKVTKVLASWRTGKTKTIDSRLVRLIAQVSDVFGGRRIRVVSGYREDSHSKSSRHVHGKALDFSVAGVPNWAVRDYLRTLGYVGVGYYPNSSFVHLDVRDETTYWVDVSAPGEAPRYTHKSRGRKQ
jgi:LysM repeat protein